MTQTVDELLRESMGLHSAKAALYEQQNELNEQARDEMLQGFEQKKAEFQNQVNGFVSSGALSLAAFKSQVFDGAIHSKGSLALPVDEADETRTAWGKVPQIATGHYLYDHHKSAILRLHRCSIAYPGYYENPRYENDKSCSKMQFVLANSNATSTQINERLGELKINPTSIGGWNASSYAAVIPSIDITGVHPYSGLFVRFVNINIHGGVPPQEITAFGGNSNFAIDRVDSYNLNF